MINKNSKKLKEDIAVNLKTTAEDLKNRMNVRDKVNWKHPDDLTASRRNEYRNLGDWLQSYYLHSSDKMMALD